MTNTLDRTIELESSVDHGTIIEVVASVDTNGDLVVFGHDVGRAPGTLPGPETHNHWVVVGEEHTELVLLHLLRERFLNSAAPTAEFMTWLQDHGILHEVASTIGEHRGPARESAKGRRRNGTRGSKPMRAGP